MVYKQIRNAFLQHKPHSTNGRDTPSLASTQQITITHHLSQEQQQELGEPTKEKWYYDYYMDSHCNTHNEKLDVCLSALELDGIGVHSIRASLAF